MLMGKGANFKALFGLDRIPFLCDKSGLSAEEVRGIQKKMQ